VSVRAALRRLPQAGERALIVGSGMVGLGLVAALRALAPGCHIAAMARYPHQASMAAQLGADEVIGREDPYAAVARLTGGHLYKGTFGNRTVVGGFDVVYDCVGSGRTVTDSLRWARAGGTVVLVGANLEPLRRVDLTPVWYQEVDLVGLYAHGSEDWEGQRVSTYDLTARLLLEGCLNPAGLVTQRFPLEAWRIAVRTAADKRSGAIKVLLDYR
ncbi:MAG: zinc-binding dehydrogenase, partial [Anaerolineales bacterium]|nr:zinc-binding dehydrogenase [Anaerolineales bacterium]